MTFGLRLNNEEWTVIERGGKNMPSSGNGKHRLQHNAGDIFEEQKYWRLSCPQHPDNGLVITPDININDSNFNSMEH